MIRILATVSSQYGLSRQGRRSARVGHGHGYRGGPERARASDNLTCRSHDQSGRQPRCGPGIRRRSTNRSHGGAIRISADTIR